MNFFELFGLGHIIFYCCLGIYFMGQCLYRYHKALENGKAEELKIYRSIR